MTTLSLLLVCYESTHSQSSHPSPRMLKSLRETCQKMLIIKFCFWAKPAKVESEIMSVSLHKKGAFHSFQRESNRIARLHL